MSFLKQNMSEAKKEAERIVEEIYKKIDWVTIAAPSVKIKL